MSGNAKHVLNYPIHPSWGSLDGVSVPIAGMRRSVIEPILQQLNRLEPMITNPNAVFDIYSHILHNAEVLDRPKAEKDYSYLHFITYCPVVRIVVRGGSPRLEVMRYTRTKGIGEARLVGNHSVGIGGHVDVTPELMANLQQIAQVAAQAESDSDFEHLRHIDHQRVMRAVILSEINSATFLREFIEEVPGLTHLDIPKPALGETEDAFLARVEAKMPDYQASTLGQAVHALSIHLSSNPPAAYLFDTSNDVGRVHLGMVQIVPWVGAPDELPTLADPALINPVWGSPDELLEEGGLESWSVELLKYLAVLDQDLAMPTHTNLRRLAFLHDAIQAGRLKDYLSEDVIDVLSQLEA